MLYEIHVTVKETADNIDKWKELCHKLNINPLFIKLFQGENQSQLMCSADFEGSMQQLRLYTYYLQREARKNGFSILRTKLECPLNHYRFLDHKPQRYFECYIKIAEEDAIDIYNVGQSLNLLVSQNQFSRKYFLNIRNYQSIENADWEFPMLIEVIKGVYPIKKVDQRCIIYDSNPNLDKGW